MIDPARPLNQTFLDIKSPLVLLKIRSDVRNNPKIMTTLTTLGFVSLETSLLNSKPSDYDYLRYNVPRISRAKYLSSKGH